MTEAPEEDLEMTDKIEEALTEYFGERCPDYVPGCSCCDAWAELDALTARADLPAAVTVKDAARSPIYALIPLAVQEAEKGMRKFPQPNYVISKWAEETGEVTKALIHNAEGRESLEAVKGEIVQALAMLHRLFVEGDRVHGLRALAEQEQEPEREECR